MSKIETKQYQKYEFLRIGTKITLIFYAVIVIGSFLLWGPMSLMSTIFILVPALANISLLYTSSLIFRKYPDNTHSKAMYVFARYYNIALPVITVLSLFIFPIWRILEAQPIKPMTIFFVIVLIPIILSVILLVILSHPSKGDNIFTNIKKCSIGLILVSIAIYFFMIISRIL